jgi:hypothetical protein
MKEKIIMRSEKEREKVRTPFDTPSNVLQPLVGEAHGDEVRVRELVDHEGVVRKLQTLRERD